MTQLVHMQAPDQDEWWVLRQQAEVIAKSGLAPSNLRGNPDAILTIALKGRELGLPPMVALNEVHIIQGKPTLSANLMRALVLRAGHRIWVDPASDDKHAIVHGQRYNPITKEYDEFIGHSSFSMEEAQAAKLTNKDNWKNYPKAMLVARATAILVRELFSDVTMGTPYTPDEVDPDTELDAEGQPVLRDDPAAAAQDYAALPSGTPAPSTDTPGEPTPPTAERGAPSDEPTPAQFAAFHKVLSDNSIDDELYRAAMRNIYDVDSVKELSKLDLSKLITSLMKTEKLNAFVQKGVEQLESEVVDGVIIPDGPEETE